MNQGPAGRAAAAFDRLATAFGRWMSNPVTFLTVFTLILAWTIAGFFLGFAERWFGAMHMAGPVVTLLLVFLLQHGQAKNTRALQLKLDELIANQGGTRKSTIKSERRSTQQMKRLERGRPASGDPGNVQDTPTGAQRRRSKDAFQRHRGAARRARTLRLRDRHRRP
jgi:low affinity Fe/Cu permease